MKTRCSNKNASNYKDYGGRGISYCERWGEFLNFFADMGERPEGTTLDRIDNNGNYEPGNCRWVAQVVQHNNKRSNRLITVDGFTRTAAHWARLLGVSRHVVLERLKLGWPEELAVTVPLGGKKHRGRALLKEEHVVLIKKFFTRHPVPVNQYGEHSGGCDFVARWFGVSVRSVRNLASGKTWGEI